MSDINRSKRQFIKTSFFAILALPFMGSLRIAVAGNKGAKEEPLPAGTSALPESDVVAMAVGYKANVKDIDFTKYPQRKKPEAKNQFCKNCALYSPVNGSWGKCQMLTAGLANSQGWCASWSKKT